MITPCRNNADIDVTHPIVQRIRRRLCSNTVLAHYFGRIRLRYDAGALTVEGSVPTLALKSLIESTLSGIENIDAIDDRVDVISATGLSRVHLARGPRRQSSAIQTHSSDARPTIA
jgi:hypothetical protein